MHFFLRILLELVSALFSFLVEWFLCYEQPLLYGGALSPVVTAFLYTVLLLVVWLLPIFYDACREKGGIAVIALNLLPTEIIFGASSFTACPSPVLPCSFYGASQRGCCGMSAMTAM